MCENCSLIDICMYKGDIWNNDNCCEDSEDEEEV